MRLRVGSRDSELAVIQTELVMEALREREPALELQMVTMKTTGDKILHKTLDQIGGKGLFVKELDEALMDGKIDISVHSLKDMPMEISPQLPLLAYMKREDERDVLVLRRGLLRLPEHPVIGTSSRRRALQAANILEGAEFASIRGNLQTRLSKLDTGEYDALILAAAGLKRLGLTDRISRYFSAAEIIPAAGQGILAVQGRADHVPFDLSTISDRDARDMAVAERSFVRTLDGGCSSPIAAFADIEEGILRLRGLYCDESGKDWRTGELSGPRSQAKEIGEMLANRLKGEARGW